MGIRPLINWYYYPSLRISVTQTEERAFRSALLYFEVYLNGLVTQWNRLVEEREYNDELMMQKDLMKDIEAGRAFSQIGDRIQLDLHFYLICWDKINKYSNVLSKHTKNQRIVEICKKIASFTGKATLARHYFEHLDEAVDKGREVYSRGWSSSTGGSMVFRYSDMSKRGKKTQRKIYLGIREVESIMKAYEDILKSLGANTIE